MTSRERVLKAFGKMNGIQDRPPIQFDLCRELIEKFGEKLGITPDYAVSYYEDLTYRISANEIRTKMGSDCIVVGGTVSSGFEVKTVRDNITLNEFGMEMKPTPLYMEVVKCPLSEVKSVADIESYHFPDPRAVGRFEKAMRDIGMFGKDYFVIGDCELSIFELAWHLTGMQEYMMALAMEEPWIELLNDRVEAWTLGLAEQLVELGVDAVWFGEDLGTQNSTLISPEMWRQKFKPRYKRMIDRLKELKPDVMIIMHSDGAVAPLIDDFIEMGIEIYNPVQPNVPGSDPEELIIKFGGRINFFGGIDQQDLLPSGDTDALKAEIEKRAAIIGKDGGYLMAPAHIIQADTDPETVEAMIETVKGLDKRLKTLAFKMKLKSGCRDEYKKRHDEIWPELKALLKENGVSDYHIFLDEETNNLFAVQKVSGDGGSQDLGKNPIVQKWWAAMEPLMETNPDSSPVSIPLDEVFFME